MTSRDVYRIPLQCVEKCSLSQQAVDINHIVVARKCEGPSATELAVVETGPTGKDNLLDDTVDDLLAINRERKPACRNRGFVLWLHQQYNNPYA